MNEAHIVDNPLWKLACTKGISRRRYLKLLAVGGAAAIIAACSDPKLPTNASPRIFKDPSPFIERQGGLETRLELLDETITADRYFFVRNNSSSLKLNTATYELVITGDAIDQQATLTYRDILELPRTTVVAYLECAGNHRAMFNLLNGQRAEGTQWERGAISNGEWTGASLKSVLALGGVDLSRAHSVLLVGNDKESPEQGFRRSLPIAKATDPSTLLAYELNGKPLPPDHGYPIRAVVPGWIGSSWIKWVSQIFVSTKPIHTRNNTDSYVLINDNYKPDGRAKGAPITEQTIKSALALPWPTRLSAGKHLIHGFAHSPDPLSQVQWSTDEGKTWHQATLQKPIARYSWVRFEFNWSPNPGDYTIMTKATDFAGNTQPDSIPFNEKGYLFNQPLPHPIKVI
ncbi:MAG: sulfite oxidase [Acidimicrobiia bacterium]|nr:sulfite oxidase [Acidimicrobiia bacterium]MCY4458728.1 sulfite oxidase [Acidimicrobiaceae bacterium]